MARSQINPTRMELIKLKNRFATTTRGHKLLKDKQDEMIRRFMEVIKDNMRLRQEVEEKLSLVMKKYNDSQINCSIDQMYEYLSVPSQQVDLKLRVDSIMNLETPMILMKENSSKVRLNYSLINSPALLDETVLEFGNLLPQIIKLAELDKKSDMLAKEIEKTRRRVNAIEYVMLPELKANIKRIQMKLDDDERSNTVRWMKSKEMSLKKELKDWLNGLT